MSRRPQVHLALDREEALALIELIATSRTLPANARPHADAAQARIETADTDRLSLGAFLRAGATTTAKIVDALYPGAVEDLDPRD